MAAFFSRSARWIGVSAEDFPGDFGRDFGSFVIAGPLKGGGGKAAVERRVWRTYRVCRRLRLSGL
jgi:hypothetical protein